MQTLDFWNLDWYGDWGQVNLSIPKYQYPNVEDQEFPTQAEPIQAKVFCERARDLVASRRQRFEINADMPLAIRLAAFKPEVHGGEFPGNE